MPAIVGGLIGTIIAIGTVIYEIGKAIFTWLIKPLTAIRDTVEAVRKTIEGVIEALRGKIDAVLEFTGVDVLVDIVRGVAYFMDRVEEIERGHKIDLIEVLGDLYRTITATASEIIHFTSLVLQPVFERLHVLKTDIERIQRFNLKDLTNRVVELGEDIKAMPEELMKHIKSEIDKESELIKEGFRGELAGVNVRLTGVIALSEDLKHFSEMFLKVMET